MHALFLFTFFPALAYSYLLPVRQVPFSKFILLPLSPHDSVGEESAATEGTLRFSFRLSTVVDAKPMS